MEVYNSLKSQLLEIHQDLSRIVSRAASIPGMSDPVIEEWEKVCRETYGHILEDVVRIAVVGTVKSGKSTLINSMFRGDYLKRGAGVVTSIVTRIRSGQSLKAVLYFKSWDEIMEDMNRALILFPALNRFSGSERFDIRKTQDRRELEAAMASLKTEQLIAVDTRNADSLLLASYLKGYDRIKDIVSSDDQIRTFEAEEFERHKEFVGDDSLAVYLKDILLEIEDSSLAGDHIEIADCQGSDSPNPLHLAMIQDYLLMAHMLVYVISSRTGLRQADIKFLSIIRKMGIINNIVFVVNFDFNEHESLDDLSALIDKIKDDLSVIKPDPEIYAFSGLYNLFGHISGNLSQKDRFRYEQWEKETAFCEFSRQHTQQFQSSLVKKITDERYSLLLKNHLERFSVLASAMEHWGAVHHEVLKEDSDQAAVIIEKISQHQNAMTPVKDMIRTTLEGASEKVVKDIKSDIDRFFDAGYGPILKDIRETIQGYSITYDHCQGHLQESGFAGALYLIFQEFRKTLDMLMAEVINPRLISFIRTEEEMIRQCFATVCRPYDAIINEALDQYNSSIKAMGISAVSVTHQKTELPDLDSVKMIHRLTISPASAAIHYKAKVKTEAVIRLGGYRVVSFFRQLLKKTKQQNPLEEEYMALKDSMRRLKGETLSSIEAHFNDYKENLKYQYISKLVDALATSCYERLLSRFNAYGANLSHMLRLIDEKRISRKDASDIVAGVADSSRQTLQRIDDVRRQLDGNRA